MTDEIEEPKRIPDSAVDPEFEADPFVFALPGQAKTVREQSLWAAVLMLLVLITYWPSTIGQFIWDDARHVSENKLLQTPQGLSTIWTQRWTDPADYPLAQYYPFTHTSYWLEYNTTGSAGGKATPFSYHVTNIVLHALSAVLLWQILIRLKVPGAWVAAAVFALHPLDVESVAWISERKNVLAGLLFFGSILLYLLGDEAEADGARAEQRWGCYAGAVLVFVLAMLSKSTACAMPAVMVLILWWKGRLTPKQWGLLAPLLVIGLLLGLSTASFERSHVGATGSEWNYTIADRFILAGRAVWFYVGKMFAPVWLSFSYTRWTLNASNVLQYLPAAGVVVVLGVLFAIRRSIGRAPFTAAAVFCVCLFPALGFFNIYPMRYTFVADHYSYFATAVFAAALVGGLTPRLPKSDGKPLIATALAAALLLSFGALAWSRAHVLLNNVSLWQDTVSKNPTSWLGHDNLGGALLTQAATDRAAGDLDAAAADLTQSIEHEKTALSLRPTDANAQWGWGLALRQLGNNKDAVEHFAAALQLEPKLTDARKDLASSLLALGRTDDAILVLNQVLALQPSSSRTHVLLGNAYRAKKNYPRAIAEYETAIASKSDNYDAREQLGRLKAMDKKYRDAALQFAFIIQATPQRWDIWNFLGMIEAEQGRLGPAEQFFKTAVAGDPMNTEYQANLRRTEAEIHRAMARRAASRPTTKSATTQVLR